jgi:hypothetical protein
MKHIFLYLVFLIIPLITIAVNPYGDDKDYESYLKNPAIYTKTVHQLNTVVMGNNFPPMVASRNYMYAAVASYEIIAMQYPERFKSLVGQLKGLKELPKLAITDTINFELTALLAYISVGESVTFPEGSMATYKDSILATARRRGLPANIEKNSKDFAAKVSAAIFAWSVKDNYPQTRTAMQFQIKPEIEGRWVPTPPGYFEAAEPHWGTIRTLVIDSASAIDVPAPPVFNIKDTSSKYYKEVMMVKSARENLTDEQKHIAIFWDDNPFKIMVNGHVMMSAKKFSPPGHWMSIVGIAAAQSKSDFPTTVYATAITSLALFDAFIECFYVKYKYATVRPEVVINKYFSPEWRPLLQTPAFPEYTCGHATISAAAAEALTKVFGDNFAYSDTSELEFGIPSRSFTSFRQAALENDLARFYGGIHYKNSCIVSNKAGISVGKIIVAKLSMEIK